ncbi:flavodoxin family protein [uncultured Desulfovibrio sp.]|uniref:flavodoxin family protein n=1 Tax=uncultured Desulfovibrio sp. TaxID=167968 RepID=UPI00280593CF|nr:flavodoxin family protein [uncultured Desulfovibrio sp.]
MNILALTDATTPNDESARFARLVFEELRNEGHDTDLLFVGREPPLHCTGCGACSKDGLCVQNDAVNAWKEKLENADAFLITANVRNSGLCSLMAALLERLAAMGAASPDFLAGKPGGFGVIGGRDGGMKAIFDIVSFFQHTRAVCVWPSYWPFTWKDGTSASFEDCDPEGRALAKDLGRQMNWVLSR